MRKLLFILVLLITIFNILLVLSVFGIVNISQIQNFTNGNMSYILLGLAIEMPLLYFLVYFSYIRPVSLLNRDIARFYTGIQDKPEIKANAWSTGMNNLITFFLKSLEILGVFKEELKDGRVLRSEIEIAADIQKQNLLKEDEIIPGLDVAIGINAASEVGGDSVDIVPGKDGNYYLYVGDVTGHGVPSGLVMMMVNALISSFSTNAVKGDYILGETNKVLKPRIKPNMMMTAIMLRWDSVNQKMYYTGAGHEYILVYKADKNKVYKIKSGGMALGMMRDISRALKEQQIAFDKDDIIILYTDGITEARYRSEQTGTLFGVDRLINSIVSAPQHTPEEIFKKITMDLSNFIGYKHVQYDDITLAVIGMNPDAKKGKTLMKIPETIDHNKIAEWNWGVKN
ncbi:PP2C family protein-serine/threonine phosphatase [Candidatus Gracilibacteria bacterium]|nr:PP2C family protein-serine/threonine phosphatase [Candidatus Gracilibacteria bacterium]